MSPDLNCISSSLLRSEPCINSLIAILTVCGQQLFSSYTFSCPCQVGKNFYYGSAFLVVPALILLIAGYALRGQMWTVASEYCCCSCTPPYRRSSPLERRLACLMFFDITGRALVAPLTWLTVTLLTGTYYECAASEFASVDQYPMFANVTPSKREEMLAGFPCYTSAPSDVIPIRDEVALLHRYQSQMLGWILVVLATIALLLSKCLARCCSPLTSLQHHYWTNHLHNERVLFEKAAEEHSQLLIRHRIKKVFGFVPGSEDIKHIRIPSCQDWREISVPNLLCVGDTSQGPYSFLGDRVVEENEEDRQEGIEMKP
ncbi:calcium homeostasis modulator protein 4 [Mus musculus]|uniref:Calcium homeostasis modulator protein 4 n=1 Tax=Mus musculus TaxID=10090 RepID=CAHM4_MOUSE|nr:calcium homeostasis modulator protein 4 [Mus musculus]Q8CE93.2 RecName: Full=Calcium homeostasis modulator protein 4; AltName: Full=Protein FAM26D [Mus musculus]EDL04880.1 mCG147134 [Mus musculus]|eukprot:NP_001074634.1 calcium homeostasis modulator protein 4 [Mus musculus]